MIISILMDLILIGIIALCAYRGFRSGLIASLIGVISLVVAIYGANLIASTFSGEFVGLLEPFVSGLVDSAEAKILGYDAEAAQSGEGEDGQPDENAPVAPLSGDEMNDAEKMSRSILKEFGISDDIADKIAAEVAKITKTVSSQMSTSLTTMVSEKLSFIAIFVIAFALIMILFTAIGNVLDLVFGLPGLENINHILGGILGAAKGIGIVVVICCLCRYLGLVLDKEIVENTWIMSRLMENNFIANILNI